MDTAPSEMWPELVRCVIARSPSKMLRTLREPDALPQVLPEVAALFDVPQIAEVPSPVVLGE